MSRSIAFFDFDGTITTRDTMLELIRYRHGRLKFYLGFLALSPLMVFMKAGVISNQQAKEKMLGLFFGGMAIDQFNKTCSEFSRACIPQLLRPAAVETLAALRKAGTDVVLVSASAENWLADWCQLNGITLIASKLELVNGKLTGKLVGQNCHGEEKVSRIKKEFDLSLYDSIVCYGDTSGDKPMLALGTESFYKPFRND